MEKHIQKTIIDYLNGIGCYVVKTVRTNRAGVADLLVCYEGKFIALEVKDTGKKHRVTKLQEYHLELVRKSGGISAVVDCLDDVKKLIGELQ